MRHCWILIVLAFALPVRAAEPVRVAAASDLQFVMPELVRAFVARHPGVEVQVVHGASGRFHAQIRRGAPFDLYLSADIRYPRSLAASGAAGGPVRAYARGRLAMWSGRHALRGVRLEELADPRFGRIAIANPRHAPYGRRAVEALRSAGVLERLGARLVRGENVAQAAHLARSGAVGVAIVSLSLALAPPMADGDWREIPESLHAPLVQGMVLTRRGAERAPARALFEFLLGRTAREILSRHGLAPAEAR